MGLLLNLFSGKEILASQLLPTFSNDLLRSLSINKSKYLLIEMPALNIPLWMEDLIYNLYLLNFITIIAHPERNKGVIENPPILYNFVEEGALVQIDAGSITGYFGKKPQKTAYLLIRHGLAHFVASDAHHPHQKRAPLVRESFKIIGENFDYSLAVRLWANNPQAVINDDFVNITTPVPFKKRFFGGWR
jgi:protein-tyrosine phosphatase